jgi:hypothetical protein
MNYLHYTIHYYTYVRVQPSIIFDRAGAQGLHEFNFSRPVT